MTRPFRSAYSSAERDEQEYVKACGECGIETILDTILDELPFDAETMDSLRSDMERALFNLSPFERAQWAARLCGHVDFETWLQDQE